MPMSVMVKRTNFSLIQRVLEEWYQINQPLKNQIKYIYWHLNSYLDFTFGEEAMQEEAVKQTDLKQFDCFSHGNRQQDNQTLSIKSFLSEKKVNQFRESILRAKSEKESSQKELSNISEKVNWAKQWLISVDKNYKIILEGHNLLITTLQFCLLNNSNHLDFVVESLKKAERYCDQAKQKLRKAETQFKIFAKAYEKQTEAHKKLLMMKYMI